MDARELYRDGKLTEAVAAMNEEVRRHPVDTRRRGFLAELLMLAGDLERADKQLDVLGTQEPESAAAIALLRQIVRAAQARDDFWNEGRPPALLGPPDECLRLLLEACIAAREGGMAEAESLAASAEEARVHVSGRRGDAPFDDLRDLDDLTSGVLEVLTAKGTYVWVPLERVVSLEFRAPARPRDLLWRAAAIEVREGPEGEVYVPATYPAGEASDALRLGRTTEWVGGDGAPVRGRGQRTFLIGDDAVPVMDITEPLVIDAPGTAEGAGAS